MGIKCCWKRHTFSSLHSPWMTWWRNAFQILLVTLLLWLLLLNDFPHLLGLERHINMRHTQCIGNGIGDRWGRTDSSSFSDAFHTEGIDGRQGHGVIKFKVGKLGSDRHGIIHKSPGQKLSILAILNSLDQRLANALGN